MKDSVPLQARPKAAARSSAATVPTTGSRRPGHEPRDMVMESRDKKFYMGQHRNETYSEVAKKVKSVQWALAQTNLSMQNQNFLTWFNRYYTIKDGGVRSCSRVKWLRTTLPLPLPLPLDLPLPCPFALPKAGCAANCNCTACPASEGSSKSSRQFRAIALNSETS